MSIPAHTFPHTLSHSFHRGFSCLPFRCFSISVRSRLVSVLTSVLHQHSSPPIALEHEARSVRRRAHHLHCLVTCSPPSSVRQECSFCTNPWRVIKRQLRNLCVEAVGRRWRMYRGAFWSRWESLLSTPRGGTQCNTQLATNKL